MRRIHKGLVVAVSTVALAVAGCGSETSTGSSSSAPSTGGEKGTLTLGATLDIQGWNPTTQPGYQSWAHEAVWDQLVKCDANGKATPDIADTFEVTDNNATFKAHIREGQKFSDGTPVDSAAVKASFEYVAKNGQSVADYKGIKIDTPDAQNISITWPEPQGPVMANKVCSSEDRACCVAEGRQVRPACRFGSVPPRCGEVDHRLGLLVHQERKPLGHGELPVQEPGGQGHHQRHRSGLGTSRRTRSTPSSSSSPRSTRSRRPAWTSSASRARPRD